MKVGDRVVVTGEGVGTLTETEGRLWKVKMAGSEDELAIPEADRASLLRPAADVAMARRWLDRICEGGADGAELPRSLRRFVRAVPETQVEFARTYFRGLGGTDKQRETASASVELLLSEIGAALGIKASTVRSRARSGKGAPKSGTVAAAPEPSPPPPLDLSLLAPGFVPDGYVIDDEEPPFPFRVVSPGRLCVCGDANYRSDRASDDIVDSLELSVRPGWWRAFHVRLSDEVDLLSLDDAALEGFMLICHHEVLSSRLPLDFREVALVHTEGATITVVDAAALDEPEIGADVLRRLYGEGTLLDRGLEVGPGGDGEVAIEACAEAEGDTVIALRIEAV